MKQIGSLLVLVLIIKSIAFSQVITVPGTEHPFYSDIIKFQDTDFTMFGGEGEFLEIVPKDNTIDLTAKDIILNETLVSNNILKSLNEFRSQYGKKPLKVNNKISLNLEHAIMYGDYVDGVTSARYAPYWTFNYVRNFENRESKFCDYLFDSMAVDADQFLELIRDDAKEVGFFYIQYENDRTYNFIIYIK